MATKPKQQNLIRDIETCSNRKVGILFNEEEAIGKYHEQAQSPLFSVLPRELRDLIWEYALAPFEDQAHPFASTEYFYRPGHTARLKTDTTLLQTCRRIFLEANAMAMLQAEHSFYYYRAAPEARSHEWMEDLTAHNRLNFGHLHLYVQMYVIERLTADPGHLRNLFLKTEPKPGDFQPRMLHVTLRHTDWWYWESEEPLRLEKSWVQAMLDSPDLRSTQIFKVELETLDYKLPQLKPILSRLRAMQSKEFETHIVDGKPVPTKFVLSEQEEEYTWTGPTNIGWGTFNHYAGMNTLKYHVTTLTWKLVFPSIPRAFIPELRRAPRLPLDYSRREEYYSYHPIAPTAPSFAPAKLPYADINTHNHRMEIFTRKHWPLPYGAEEFFLSKLRHQAVRYVTRKQADDLEEHRREVFAREMTTTLPAKWEAEGSLLGYEEVEEERYVWSKEFGSEAPAPVVKPS